MRQQWRFGFGIEAGDKGFRMPGHIDISHEERMAEINAELQARDREMAEERKAQEEVVPIEILDENTRRSREVMKIFRQRQEADAARKAEMEREPSE